MGYTRQDVEPVERSPDSDDAGAGSADRSLADVLSGRLADLDVDSGAAVRAVRERE
jgi:hypothetical protein